VRAEKPRLVVNIVVSQLRADQLERWAHNLDDRGMAKLAKEGTVFDDARYDYMITSTPAGLATITTGTDPSTHGVVSPYWVDYTTGQRVSLIEDPAAHGLGCDAGLGKFSAHNITVPTLADRLREADPLSRTVTIAADPLSAVAMGGKKSPVYWMDAGRGCWGSSTAYMDELPQWVLEYNDQRTAREWLGYVWKPLFDQTRYMAWSPLGHTAKTYPELLLTPVGNTLAAEFAKRAIDGERLGEDEHTDILNICFDTPRTVGELYGGESMEAEDMFYRLDIEIGDLLGYLHYKVNLNRVVVVLTSDHGASDPNAEKFNAAQFKVIINGFLNAQYGAGSWVAGYVDRQLYLDRNMVYQKGLSLEEVQNRVAAFALQFRGVSHVLTSTAMQSSYFGGSYAQKMQNSFYPRRGGDLTINLMPGWVEEKDGAVATSGSMYGYDTHVPLMVLGTSARRVARTVNMRDLAPSLAHIMQISRPVASDGGTIDELINGRQ
jgi:arylsulfatase A-like enzyme